MSLSLLGHKISVFSSGTGNTKDDATKIALRNALEEAYGAFISSSTKIVDDVLVSDEIISISQGNIKNYELMDAITLEKGLTTVNVKSTISLNKLSNFCQSKGMTVSFNGSAFNMNLKMMEFNEKNEFEAFKNMVEQILGLRQSIYDFDLKVNEPTIDGNEVHIVMEVKYENNENYNNIMSFIKKTLSGISMSKAERKSYEKVRKSTYGVGSSRENLWNHSRNYDYYFRNENTEKLYNLILGSPYNKRPKPSSYIDMMKFVFMIQIDNGDNIAVAFRNKSFMDAMVNNQIDNEKCKMDFIDEVKNDLRAGTIFQKRKQCYRFDYKIHKDQLDKVSSIKIISFYEEKFDEIKKIIMQQL